MKLDLFNNIINNVKENTFLQNFMKDLSNHLEKENEKLENNNLKNNISSNTLKQENCLYQVIEVGTGYAYLLNTQNNKICKETEIPQNILDKIGNDTVLQYKGGQYNIDDELTKKFLDNLIDIQEYEKIQNNFIKESNILNIDSNTKYKIIEKQENYCILNYGNEETSIIKVPNALIPFWANIGENLYYKNGEFKRDI